MYRQGDHNFVCLIFSFAFEESAIHSLYTFLGKGSFELMPIADGSETAQNATRSRGDEVVADYLVAKS